MAHGQKSSDADPLRRRMTHSSLGTCMKKDFLAEASDFPIRHPIREILVHEVSNLYCDRGWRICPGEIPFLYWHLSRREKRGTKRLGILGEERCSSARLTTYSIRYIPGSWRPFVEALLQLGLAQAPHIPRGRSGSASPTSQSP